MLLHASANPGVSVSRKNGNEKKPSSGHRFFPLGFSGRFLIKGKVSTSLSCRDFFICGERKLRQPHLSCASLEMAVAGAGRSFSSFSGVRLRTPSPIGVRMRFSGRAEVSGRTASPSMRPVLPTSGFLPAPDPFPLLPTLFSPTNTRIQRSAGGKYGDESRPD